MDNSFCRWQNPCIPYVSMSRDVGLYVDVRWCDIALYPSHMIMFRNVQVSLILIFVKSLIVITWIISFVSLITPPYHLRAQLIFNELLHYISGDVMNMVTLSTWYYVPNTNKKKLQTTIGTIENCTTLETDKMYSDIKYNFS